MNIRTKLQTIADNLAWTWTPRAQALFERVDAALWEKSRHTPKAVLRDASDAMIRKAFASDEALAELNAVYTMLHAYLGDTDTWVHRNTPQLERGMVAYFCAEFGMHESIPLYSGGLGVLAGDHIKTASDMGVPFVGIGLKYPEGYFRQSIDADGLQQQSYPETDWETIPAELVMHADEPMLIAVPIADRSIFCKVWRMDVGRVQLYLLDTDVPSNNEDDRAIGGRLYSGGHETRIRQEALLGIGGVRLLRALGFMPDVYHLNEGHSAFACYELMRERMNDGESFEQAHAWVRKHTVFTTHTPVPAGHDRFAPDLVQMMLWQMQRAMGLDWHRFLGLGRINPHDMDEPFTMTILAMKCAEDINGVSKLHGAVTRDMWKDLWGGWNVNDIPVGHVTNGIHVETFMHPHLRDVLDTRFAGTWQDALLDNDAWAAMIDEFSDEEILELKKTLKLDMFRTLKLRLETHRDALGPDVDWMLGAIGNWRADALTIGFARRFATYKRGSMLFQDMERAIALIGSSDRPVQLIFSGKAHPKDVPGKEVIRKVVETARSSALRGRILFMEDYDMSIAKSMISGVDVWLNTPRRPREASGTSGQKVNMHGGVNCSILDGWWAEGYDGDNGFAIGGESVPHSPEQQDREDFVALYDVLENQVVPEYYETTPAGRGPKWLSRMRASMSTLPAEFSTRRMLKDYITRYYARPR